MKTLKELCTGDVVKLADGGTAEITGVSPCSWIRRADGPAVSVEWKVISGPLKGEKGYYVGTPYEEVDA